MPSLTYWGDHKARRTELFNYTLILSESEIELLNQGETEEVGKSKR